MTTKAPGLGAFRNDLHERSFHAADCNAALADANDQWFSMTQYEKSGSDCSKPDFHLNRSEKRSSSH